MYIKNFRNEAGELLVKIPRDLERDFSQRFTSARFNRLGKFWAVPVEESDLAQKWINEARER